MPQALLEIFQSPLGTLVSSLPMMSCAKHLTFFMGFGFFQEFEVSNSDTWSQNIFSIYKTFTRYFWLQNAHKPNMKMQWFLITIVRRFFFLIWPWTRYCGWIFCLQYNISVDFVNPQGMAILGNFTCGYIGYIHRGLWPLYFWPTHLRQALTKVFHNSNLVNIICLPYCHAVFVIKSLFLQLKERFWHLQEKKAVAWVVFKRNNHCNNFNSFKKGVTLDNKIILKKIIKEYNVFYIMKGLKWGLIANCCFIKWASNSVEKCLK